ncbi:MAG: FHA domain-containing protein [Desulfobacteraceae bacterium]|nr:MAG: FHA domain-containing protein [Desulfobacteraceae bacterium]
MHNLTITVGPLKGQTFDLNADPFLIGRSSKNHIQIKDDAISRKQLKIFKVGKRLFVEDLKSTNGTLINDEMITPGESVEVKEGDTISIANTMMCLGEDSSGQALDIEAGQNDKPKPAKERRSQSPKNLELVYKVTELLRQALSIDEIIDRVLEYLLDAFPRIDRVAILLSDNNKNEIRRVISRSRQDPEELHFIYNRKIVSQVMTEGKPVSVADTHRETQDNLESGMGTVQIESVMCVPMISSSEILGAIYIDSIRSPSGFRKDDMLLLESLSGPVAVAIEKAMLASRLQGSLSEIKIIR